MRISWHQLSETVRDGDKITIGTLKTLLWRNLSPRTLSSPAAKLRKERVFWQGKNEARPVEPRLSCVFSIWVFSAFEIQQHNKFILLFLEAAKCQAGRQEEKWKAEQIKERSESLKKRLDLGKLILRHSFSSHRQIVFVNVQVPEVQK